MKKSLALCFAAGIAWAGAYRGHGEGEAAQQATETPKLSASLPDAYAQTPRAQTGLTKLRAYFAKNPPPNLHHQIWLLWASLKLDGFMTADLKKQTIRDLLALQREDGGWNLPSLRAFGKNDENGGKHGT